LYFNAKHQFLYIDVQICSRNACFVKLKYASVRCISFRINYFCFFRKLRSSFVFKTINYCNFVLCDTPHPQTGAAARDATQCGSVSERFLKLSRIATVSYFTIHKCNNFKHEKISWKKRSTKLMSSLERFKKVGLFNSRVGEPEPHHNVYLNLQRKWRGSATLFNRVCKNINNKKFSLQKIKHTKTRTPKRKEKNLEHLFQIRVATPLHFDMALALGLKNNSAPVLAPTPFLWLIKFKIQKYMQNLLHRTDVYVSEKRLFLQCKNLHIPEIFNSYCILYFQLQKYKELLLATGILYWLTFWAYKVQRKFAT
jgi:hypothetical protein